MVGFVSDCCRGEKCWCGEPAVAKVEEAIMPDDPLPYRHPLTAYICRDHFVQLMGPGQTARFRPVRVA